MARKTKANLEFLLVNAELTGIPEKGLLRSRNIGQVDLIWPRTGVAKKSGAREMVFKRGVCDFTAEPWTKRVVFREEVLSAPSLVAVLSGHLHRMLCASVRGKHLFTIPKCNNGLYWDISIGPEM